MPGACKVCHRAINRLRNEHESSRAKTLAGVLSGKSNTRPQGRVCDGLRLDKKSLYLALHLETRLECGYHIFALSSLTTTFCVNSPLGFAGKHWNSCSLQWFMLQTKPVKYWCSTMCVKNYDTTTLTSSKPAVPHWCDDLETIHCHSLQTTWFKWIVFVPAARTNVSTIVMRLDGGWKR